MNVETPWRVRSFGGFTVERGGKRIDRFRTQHALALLTYLSLYPDVRHSREVLAEHLWPNVDPLTARQRLSNALANLRSVLEADGVPVFFGGRDSLGVHSESLASDAAEFNRLVRQARAASRERRRQLLREALELAEKGEFLPGIYFEWAVEKSAEFEETVSELRAELDLDHAADPVPATDPSSLIGRTSEVEFLDRLVAERTRCISILGAGGVGKTRLALDLFERHSHRLSGPAAFVRLAEVRNPDDFLAAIADALRLRFSKTDDLESAIAAALAVPGLLVLDNLEHLLPEIHGPLDSLIRSCGHCIFVATSRRRLAIAGEQVLRLTPLRLPPALGGEDLIAEAPAIRLFVSRYLEFGGPPLQPSDMPAAAQICRSLGGLPLAIQLAASASVTVGLAALCDASLLSRHLPSRSPDLTNVHTSLGALIDWSLTLIDRKTRRVLDALSLLPGAFTFHMVRELLGEEAATTLTRLHGDSLIEADGKGSMRVLEPIRDHLASRLSPDTEAELQKELVHRCAAIATEFESRLSGPDQKEAAEDARAFWPTMRLSVQWAGRHGLPDKAFQILAGFSRLLVIDMNYREAVALWRSVPTQPEPDPRLLAQAYALMSRHEFWTAEFDASGLHAKLGLEIARRIGDRRTEARCTTQLAYLEFIREDQEATLTLAERALDQGRQAGDVESQVWSLVVTALAHSLYKGEVPEAEVERTYHEVNVHFEAAEKLARDARDDLLEGAVLYSSSAHAGRDFDLFCARLSRSSEIFRTNGWKLREALSRSALLIRQYAGGQYSNALEDVRALQTIFGEGGRWDLRAEHVGIEAEMLFRAGLIVEARAAIDEAIRVLRLSDRYFVVELHVQAIIYAALGEEMDEPLLRLVEHANRSDFNSMMGELARALLEVKRGEVDSGLHRLRHYGPESKPVRVQHALADTLVAVAELISDRSPSQAIVAYRRARAIYRQLHSRLDLKRVRRLIRASRGGRSHSLAHSK